MLDSGTRRQCRKAEPEENGRGADDGEGKCKRRRVKADRRVESRLVGASAFNTSIPHCQHEAEHTTAAASTKFSVSR